MQPLSGRRRRDHQAYVPTSKIMDSKTESALTLAQQHQPRLARYAEVLIQGEELLS
jgi:hypothetical protein